MNKIYYVIVFALLLVACSEPQRQSNLDINHKQELETLPQTTYLEVLGTVQDAGYPQIGCMKACCRENWSPEAQTKYITCLGLVNPENQKLWMFEASPDFKQQSQVLARQVDENAIKMPDGIFLTHGHIGHYVGLMQLGREAINANQVPVYAMPRMKNYLENNGPWSQLVALENIAIQALKADSSISLDEHLSVIPYLVPHRGEYTETVGYQINGKHKKVLFIPDIDKWHLWERSIEEAIKNVDFTFLDATFYKNGEVGNRDMSEIPHPFVEESMELFDRLPKEERDKIYFIHFNHTNPLLIEGSEAQKEVEQKGYHIAKQGMRIEL